MTKFVPFVLPCANLPLTRAGAGLCLLLSIAIGTAPRAVLSQPAPEQGSPSLWVKDLHSALALIGGARHGADATGGIAIRLDPGWKTYWRTPGDSGVPPRFDFSASENVADVTVLWPAPKQFPDGSGGISFGYMDDLVLPLRIVAKEPDSPVTLRARISYAVCKELCLPVEATSELTLAPSSAPDNSAIAAALARVPQPATIGTTDPVGIRAVRRDGKTVTVDVAAPAGDHLALFAEGPTLDWALPPPQSTETAPAGLHRFSFALEGLPSDARPEGATLKLTLTDGDRAFAYDVKLD